MLSKNAEVDNLLTQAFEGFNLRKAVVKGFQAGEGNSPAIKQAFILFLHNYAEKELDNSGIPSLILSQVRSKILEWFDGLMERLFDDLTRVS